MISIQDNKECCGCSACYSVCPRNAISMIEDEEGFLYPRVDKARCVACGLCDEACPMHGVAVPEKPLFACLVQNKSKEIRFRSTSGAAVNAVAEYVLRNGGYVFGAELTDQIVCQHCIIEQERDLYRIQGSKYVQSEINECFIQVKQKLKQGYQVLFIGMPCQVAGLKNVVKGLDEKLITMDLACHGVPSPGILRDFAQNLARIHKKKVTNIVFRDKSYGYSASNVKIYFADGSTRDCKNDVKTFTRLMFSGLSLRPSCYECKFKTVGRVSDFTLFDCAMVGQYAPELDDDSGTTSVLVHSPKGAELLKKPEVANKIVLHSADIDELVKTEGTMLTASAKKNPRRDNFFADRRMMDYQALTQKYAPVTLKMLIGNTVKQSLRLTGPVGKMLLNYNKKRSIKKYQKKYGTK